jgi:hypothetical protein
MSHSKRGQLTWATRILVGGVMLAAGVLVGANAATPAHGQTTQGELTICKVAGAGVASGTPFTFTVTTVGTVVVPAGTGALGSASCVSVGSFPQGTQVTVQETTGSGVQVSTITVGESAVLVSSNVSTGTAVVGVGGFHNQVTFTNTQTATTCPTAQGTVTLRPFLTGHTQVNFCHGTGSATNPYVVLDLPISGACGHYREHYLGRPPGSQFRDVFPSGFLAVAGTLCAQ